ncbi:ABC transporter permease [Segetibacter sp. 3557_3]|uniref:ABC transporter permease n=1 Tax=Segetibacter sp. 3557_3 TaxID=2547429 RepID=UPI00105900B5|nr:ABC transporter permease [Segetibacter sp. 3557_3]TDH23287.1 ABC transporter permease [Segetibacter sp. 3557_3]
METTIRKDQDTAASYGDWDMVIEPQTSSLNLKLGDVWQYRDLLMLLVRRDFVSFYKQTVLGPVWFFIQPLFTTIIYTFIFGDLAGISTDGIEPKALFYVAGVTCWNYFAECLTKTSTVFKDNSNVFGKVYFPRLIMPLSIVMSNLIKFGVQMLLFAVMMIYFSLLGGGTFHLTWYVLLFPVLVVQMALLGLGLGMIISALTTKYRDLVFLVTFGVQLLMYATTVVYPLSKAPEKYKWLISLNPMTPIIETFRYGFLGAGTFTWASLAISAAITLGITLFGIIIFNKVERNFIDTV